MSTPSVHLHRVLRAPPERVYRAFTEPGAMTKWFPPRGYTCQVDHVDVREGGSFRMAFIEFASGQVTAFGGTYLEVVPHERLRYTDRFDDPNLPGEMEVTVQLRAVSCGTELHITQAGIPAVIPLELCYLGWQDTLTQLAALVEQGAPAA